MVAGADTPSTTILGSYANVDAPTPLRTARQLTGSSEMALKQAARNLKALDTAQTPLLGQDLAVDGEISFETPLRNLNQTPNPLTAMVASKGTATPRDQMGINTPRVQVFKEPYRTHKLSSLFEKLPKPKNDFEIVLPESVPIVEKDAIREYSEDFLKRQELELKQQQESALKKRSRVLQFGLPRPVINYNLVNNLYSKNEDPVQKLINQEKAKLLFSDAKKYKFIKQNVIDFEFLDVDEQYNNSESVDSLIRTEISQPVDLVIPQMFDDYNIDPSNGRVIKKIDENTMKSQFSDLKQQIQRMALASQKQEQKLNITLGGHIQRLKNLSASLALKNEELADKHTFLEICQTLYLKESAILERRIEEESKEMQRLFGIEQDLQNKYREISTRTC